MNRIRYIFIVGLLMALLSPLNAFAQPKDDDIWPWPWGTECPFPWNDIEGLWKIKDKPSAGFFRFTLTKTVNDEGYLVKVDHIDIHGSVTASGSGFTSYSQKIVRAALHTRLSGRKKSYWLIVRAYEKNKQVGCNGNVQTVVTLRPVFSDKSWDLNYEIEQVQYEMAKKQ